MHHQMQRIAACILSAVILFLASTARADDPPAAVVQSVWLKDVDLSSEITPPKTEPTSTPPGVVLKPRIIPDYEQLHDAIWAGSANRFEALLANGGDPNALSEEGDPLLDYAVWNGHKEFVESLLDAGADPDLPDESGDTVLGRAVWSGKTEIARLLLSYGADPNRPGRSNNTPLTTAKYYNRHEIVKMMTDGVPQVARQRRPPARSKIVRVPLRQFGSKRFRVGGGGKALAYSADGRTLFAGGNDGAIRLFDAHTGVLKRVLVGHEGEIDGIALVPNSSLLVSVGDDKTARFWDLRQGTEVKRLKRRFGQGKAVSVSPDGRYVNTGVHTWEIASLDPLTLAPKGRVIKDPKQDHIILWSFFTPDGRYLVLSRNSLGIWVWDLATDRLAQIQPENTLSEITWGDLAEVVDIGAADPKGLLALAQTQYTILVASDGVLQAARGKYANFRYWQEALAVSPRGGYLAGIGYGPSIYILDIESGKRFDDRGGHTAAVLSCSLSPDGRLLASGGNDLAVRLWDVATGKQLDRFDAGSFVYCVRFSPDGRLVAVGDNSGRIHLWDLASGKQETLYAQSGRVTDMAFDAEHQLLASTSSGASVNLLDLKTRQTRLRISHTSGADSVAVSRDFRWLITGDSSQAAGESGEYPLFWPLDNLLHHDKVDFNGIGYEAIVTPRAERPHTSGIISLDVSPDGKLLASGSYDASVQLWDMQKKESVARLCGHINSVWAVQFSPDSRWLASGSSDGTVAIWDTRSGRRIAVLDADVYNVNDISFSPDGRTLAAANGDGTVHLWDLTALLRH